MCNINTMLYFNLFNTIYKKLFIRKQHSFENKHQDAKEQSVNVQNKKYQIPEFEFFMQIIIF